MKHKHEKCTQSLWKRNKSIKNIDTVNQVLVILELEDLEKHIDVTGEQT